MILHRAARVDVRWPVTADVPLDTLGDPQVWLAGAWHPATVAAEPDATSGHVVLLIAGPEAPDDDTDAVTLDYGMHVPAVRFDDDPEVLVETSSPIVVA